MSPEGAVTAPLRPERPVVKKDIVLDPVFNRETVKTTLQRPAGAILLDLSPNPNEAVVVAVYPDGEDISMVEDQVIENIVRRVREMHKASTLPPPEDRAFIPIIGDYTSTEISIIRQFSLMERTHRILPVEARDVGPLPLTPIPLIEIQQAMELKPMMPAGFRYKGILALVAVMKMASGRKS